MSSSRELFLTTARAVRPLLASDALAQRWDEPSALAELTNGALAAHLARAVLVVAPYLDGEPPSPGTQLPNAAEYFVTLSLSNDVDHPMNVGIRERSAEGAKGGPAVLLDAFDQALTALEARLESEPPDRAMRVVADMPISLDEYLLTRVLELVVHGDDLAVSIGADAQLPAASTSAAIACLLEIARRRHGDVAVIRAFARRERDTVDALRVL